MITLLILQENANLNQVYLIALLVKFLIRQNNANPALTIVQPVTLKMELKSVTLVQAISFILIKLKLVLVPLMEILNISQPLSVIGEL